MYYLAAVNLFLLFSKYNTPHVVTFKQFISQTIINKYIVEFLVGNIVNFYCLKTHS